jgi:hypothetical protein
MPKEFKPGWEYIHSSPLKQEIAVNIKTGEVYCEDRTMLVYNALLGIK